MVEDALGIEEQDCIITPGASRIAPQTKTLKGFLDQCIHDIFTSVPPGLIEIFTNEEMIPIFKETDYKNNV
jgi:hypothetical protein